MAKGKKKGKASKKQGKRSVRGYAERVQESKPEKKSKGLRSMLKPGIGMGLDLLSTIFPMLGPVRSIVKGVTGFDERVDLTSGSSEVGGTTVQTMNAPVAFARNQVKTGFARLGETDDGEIWRFTDLTTPLATHATTASTFRSAAYGLIPTSSTAFPNYSVEAEMWERWRPLHARIHYCHFAPTSSQAAVMLAWYDDVLETQSSVAGSTSLMMALKYSVQGSCYEDFGLDILPETWKEGTWLYNAVSPAATADTRFNYAGEVVIATDANVPINTQVGYVYTEMTFQVSGKQVPWSSIGRVIRMRRTLSQVPPEQREAFVDFVLGGIRSEVLSEVKKIAPPVPSLLLEFQRGGAGPLGLGFEDHPKVESVTNSISKIDLSVSQTARPSISTAALVRR